MKKKRIAATKPKPEKVCTGRDLANALAEANLTELEAKAWRKDLYQARKALKTR